MSPEFTGFALGLLLGAAKVMAIAAVGFGVAWRRARGRIRALEAEQRETDRQILESDNLHQINESLSDLRLYLERLDITQYCGKLAGRCETTVRVPCQGALERGIQCHRDVRTRIPERRWWLGDSPGHAIHDSHWRGTARQHEP